MSQLTNVLRLENFAHFKTKKKINSGSFHKLSVYWLSGTVLRTVKTTGWLRIAGAPIGVRMVTSRWPGTVATMQCGIASYPIV